MKTTHPIDSVGFQSHQDYRKESVDIEDVD